MTFVSYSKPAITIRASMINKFDILIKVILCSLKKIKRYKGQATRSFSTRKRQTKLSEAVGSFEQYIYMTHNFARTREVSRTMHVPVNLIFTIGIVNPMYINSKHVLGWYSDLIFTQEARLLLCISTLISYTTYVLPAKYPLNGLPVQVQYLDKIVDPPAGLIDGSVRMK